MTDARAAVCRGTRLAIQLVITAIAIAATVLFSCALQRSAHTGTSHSGHTPTATSTART